MTHRTAGVFRRIGRAAWMLLLVLAAVMLTGAAAGMAETAASSVQPEEPDQVVMDSLESIVQPEKPAAASIVSPVEPAEPGPYTMASLEFYPDHAYAGNSVTVYWTLPEEFAYDWYWDLHLWRTDEQGNTVDCGEADPVDEMSVFPDEGSMTVAFGPEETGTFTFSLRGEFRDHGLCEFTSDITLTVTAHGEPEISVIWKNAEGQEITEAVVGQPVTAEWSLSGVRLDGQGGYAYLSTNNVWLYNHRIEGNSGSVTFIPTHAGVSPLRAQGRDDDGFEINVVTTQELSVVSPLTGATETEALEGKDRVTASITGLGAGSGRTAVSASWYVTYTRGEYEYGTNVPVDPETVESWNSTEGPVTCTRDFTWGNATGLSIRYMDGGTECRAELEPVTLSGYAVPEIQISFSGYPGTVDVSEENMTQLSWRVTGADRISTIEWTIETSGSMGSDPYEDYDCRYYDVELETDGLVPNADGSFSGAAWVWLPAVAIHAELRISAVKDGFEDYGSSYRIQTTGAEFLDESPSVTFGEPVVSNEGTVEWPVQVLNQLVPLERAECRLTGEDGTELTGIFREEDSVCVFENVKDGTYRLHIFGTDMVDRNFSGTSAETVTVAAGGIVPEVTGITTETGDGTVNLRDNLLTATVVNAGAEGTTAGRFVYVTPEGTADIAEAMRNPVPESGGEAVFSARWNIAEVSAGEYEVHFILTYGAGNSVENAMTVTVVRKIPARIETVVAADDLTCVRLNWAMAAEIDIAGYAIFRRAEGEDAYAQIGTVTGRENRTWADSEVSRGVRYSYYVCAVSDVGEMSAAGGTAEVLHEGDTEAPVIISITPESGSRMGGTVHASLRAQDNLAVTESVLEWSRDGGETWTEFGRAAGGSLSCVLETAGMADGEILIRGMARDEAGNESIPMTRTWVTDNTAPAQVAGLACTNAAPTILTLQWDDVPDEDATAFLVEKREGDVWVRAGTVTTLGMNLQGLTPGTAYTLRVAATDQCGNTGLWSEELTAETAADTDAPVITQWLPAAERFADRVGVGVTAKDNYNIASVAVEVRTEDGEWTSLWDSHFEDLPAARERTVSALGDLTPFGEGTLLARVTVKDSAGNACTAERTWTVDRTAPAAPTGVTAKGRSDAVEILWEQGPETDIEAYAVYRAESEDGEYTLLNGFVRALNWFDRTAERGVTYAYRVQAVDLAGNRSELSAAVTGGIVPDTEAPQVLRMVPEAGSALGPNGCTVQVLATDNIALESVRIQSSTDGVNYTQVALTEGIGVRGQWVSCTLENITWTDGATLHVRVIATDEAGNESAPLDAVYTMDTAAPGIVAAVAEYSEEDGSVRITWQGGSESDLAGYRIYRKAEDGNWRFIGSRSAGAETAFTDSRPAAADGEYAYRIEAEDGCGNVSSADASCAAPETPPEEPAPPEVIITCDAAMEVGVEYRLGGSADREIAEWTWNFGDGSESSEAAPVHAWAENGTYTVTLTVTDAEGRQGTAERKVTICSRTMLGTLEVQVVDGDGAAVPGASVYLDLGDEDQTVRATDERGRVSFTAAAGSHVIGAFIADNQWLPAQTRAIVTAGETAEKTLVLVHQPMVEGSFETHRMTFDEIVAAGIDPTDPENRNYVQINLHLTYQAEDYTESFPFNYNDPDPTPIIIDIDRGSEDDDRQLIIHPLIVGGDNWNHHGGGSGGSNYEFSGEDISLAVLDVPVGISALKDFFEVKLYIINNAGSEFSMVDNTVKLNIPAGLSLMDTYRSEKSAEVHRAEIRGQTTETMLWILRGDAMGEYRLSADYSGILDRFGAEIHTRFEAEEPIRVPGLSGAKVTIEIAEEMDRDRLYYNVLLENGGEADLYCPDIETEDELIRMDLFGPEAAARAKQIRYDAEMLDALSISVAPTVDPNVFAPGALLIKHFVNYGDTQYTEKRLKLENWGYTLQDSFGIEVELVTKPLSWFTGYLGIGVSPAQMDQGDLDTLMDNWNYVYWHLYKSKDPESGLYLRNKAGEFLWDLCSFAGGNGSIKELFDLDHIENTEALIVSAMGISVEEAEGYGTAQTVLEFLQSFKKHLNLLDLNNVLEAILGTDLPGDIDLGTWVSETITLIEEEHSGELIDLVMRGGGDIAAFFSKFARQTEYFETNVEILTNALIDEDMAEAFFEGLFEVKDFEKVWENIGYGLDVAEDIVEATKDTAFDMSVALAAQSDLKACVLFLDALIEADGPLDQLTVRAAARNVKEVVVNNNIAEMALKNFIRNGLYRLAEYAGEKGMEFIKNAASSNAIIWAVRAGLSIVTAVGEEYFHVSETNDLADNIRYLAVISDDIRQALVRGGYTNEETVELIGYLLELRRMGESQVAQFGMSQEIIRYLCDSEELFLASRRISVPTSAYSDVNSWQTWRDYVEDRISALGTRLMKRPTYPYGVNLKAPVLTVDYAREETAQRFSADYKWRVSGQSEWMACTGEPIPVKPGEEPYVLLVRNVHADPGEERLTAAVRVDTAPDLSQEGIEITATENGYLLEFPDNDLVYSYTLSEERLDTEAMTALENQIPEGSYSFEMTAEPEDRYLYLRSAATPERFASRIWQISLERVRMREFVFSEPVEGTVELIGYNGTETRLVIPAEVPQDDGSVRRVTGIGDGALKDHTGLETVWIPEGVKSVGNSAFEGCMSLRFAALPESVTFIGSAAFRGCAAMEWASVPGKASVGTDAFADCSGSLTAIVTAGSPAEKKLTGAGIACAAPAMMPAGLTEIREAAFEGAGFAAVILPAECTEVGSLAFTGCAKLHVVRLEGGATVIAQDAFPEQEIVFYVPAGSAVYAQLTEAGRRVYATGE